MICKTQTKIQCIIHWLQVHFVITECQSESQLNSNQHVDSVTVNGLPINTGNLFEFDTDVLHCGPSDVGSFNIIISYSSPVLLTEIGIHGRDRTFSSDEYVTRFSLLFSEDGDNFTEYIRDTGSTVCYSNNPH